MNKFHLLVLIIAVPLAILAVAGAILAPQPVQAAPETRPLYATCVVTNNNDSGPGSLRECILTAGAGDTITFDPTVFPPTNPATIALTSFLPDITQGNLTIDGSGAGVILDGSAQPTYGGLWIASNGNVIKGLQILNFGGDGIRITDGGKYNTIANNVISGNDLWGIVLWGSGVMSNTVVGNFIGTDPSGTAAMGNARAGIGIFLGAQHNVIGGETLEERNIISGNDEGGVVIGDNGTNYNQVKGNYVGLASNGTASLGNGQYGVAIQNGAAYNTVGGPTSGERNIISGNNWSGVGVGGNDNRISGNYIGTNSSGTAAVPNNGYGVQVGGGGTHNLIGGSNPSPGGACSGECNLISGNNETGVTLEDSATDHNTVSGNYIGTNASGTASIPNGDMGIHIFQGASYNSIGGDTPGKRNLVSGNTGSGISIVDNGTNYNVVSGNYIGLTASGTAALPNTGFGVGLGRGASYNKIGGDGSDEGNTIRGNLDHGIEVNGSNTLANTISRNAIYDNEGQGIRLIDGGNTGLTAPIVITYNLSAGTASGTACPSCTIEVFSGDDDEGRFYEGTTAANAGGNWSFVKGSALFGPYVTATATDPAGNTSEFGTAGPPPTPPTRFSYLPLVSKGEAPSGIFLYIESINTGGIDPVEIRDPENGNALLLSCIVGNNVTRFCGTFPPVGTYTIIAYTANCGQLGPTQFSDASTGGTQITRTILCQ